MRRAKRRELVDMYEMQEADKRLQEALYKRRAAHFDNPSEALFLQVENVQFQAHYTRLVSRL